MRVQRTEVSSLGVGRVGQNCLPCLKQSSEATGPLSGPKLENEGQDLNSLKQGPSHLA